MRRKYLTGPIALLCCAAIPLSGCSGGPTEVENDQVTVGTLEPTHLIPGNASGAFEVLSTLFTPLVGTASDGSIKYLQAESVTPSDGSRVWTIKIRPGWKFHNGEPVTAQSYARGWNMTAYGPNAHTNTGQLSNIAGYGDLNPTSGKPTAKKLSGVQVVDDTTLRVTLSKPDSQFPYQLTGNQLGFYPLPKAALEDPEAYDLKPIGNGPYEMDGRWQHNEQIPVKKYPEYKGPGKSHIDNISFKIYSNIETAYTDVQAGSLDLAPVPQTK